MGKEGKKIINDTYEKITRLEKRLNILELKVARLENKESKEK